VQRAMLAVGAPIGRMLGYRPIYTRKPATATAPAPARTALAAA